MIGIKVQHDTFGIGKVIEFDGKYVKVEFVEKTAKFVYPGAFENIIRAEDPEIQQKIIDVINAKKAAAEEERLAKEADSKAKEERRRAIEAERQAAAEKRRKIGMFGADYHAEHLSLDKCFTYQQVEAKYGINRRFYGHGINVLDDKIILISSVDKAGGAFVYHDKWTEDGDFIYSGKGLEGDQTMAGDNLAVNNAAADGKEILLFVKLSSEEYYYQGVFELVIPTVEPALDKDGNIRQEIKFRLKKVHP